MASVQAVKAAIEEGFRGSIEEGAPLAGYTSFNIGGPADLLVAPRGPEDLYSVVEAAGENGVDLLVLGRGSNVLVSDRGFRGVVTVLSRGLGRIIRKGEDTVEVDAGCDLNRLVSWTIERGTGGLENLAGIPGTIGGAVRVNAGALGVSVGDVVQEVRVIRFDSGGVKYIVIPAAAIVFGYRETNLTDKDIIYKVKLKLNLEVGEDLEERRKEVLGWRRKNQPLSRPSAGSVFRNPPEMTAGEIIERCGLKGASEGDAVVSEKHANFIVNNGKAKASDVRRLIDRIKREVLEREGIRLREEIRFIGEMGERAEWQV